MIGLLDRLALSFLRRFDPEDAHALTIRMLQLAPPLATWADDERLAVHALGLDFPNPIGVAAGLDKNAEISDALLRAGFGFVEAGTVTPRPQPGNPRPRLFRLDAEQAVINRLGFNSQGADAVRARLTARAAPGRPSGIVGVNVGANKDSADRTGDYVQMVERFAPLASYIVVNISSPNTPGLRDLQRAEVLDELVARVLDARERVGRRAGSPVLLKIAPDLSLTELDDIVRIAARRHADGVIVGNTTVARPASVSANAQAKEAGGLSGRPLAPLATRMLAEAYVRAQGVFQLIGVGGIDSGAAAVARVRAGARLIQLYSALVFQGFGLLAEVKAALLAELEREKMKSLAELTGIDATHVTTDPWPS